MRLQAGKNAERLLYDDGGKQRRLSLDSTPCRDVDAGSGLDSSITMWIPSVRPSVLQTTLFLETNQYPIPPPLEPLKNAKSI